MPITFRTVASGLVSRLTAQLTYLNTCRFYAGEVEDLGSGQPFDQAPAAFVIFDGMDPIEDMESFDSLLYRARYGVVIVAKSVDGRTDVAEGDTYSAHRMIEDVFAAVSEHNLGLTGFDGLAPGSVRRIKITSNAAIYVVELVGNVAITK